MLRCRPGAKARLPPAKKARRARYNDHQVFCATHPTDVRSHRAQEVLSPREDALLSYLLLSLFLNAVKALPHPQKGSLASLRFQPCRGARMRAVFQYSQATLTVRQTDRALRILQGSQGASC